MSARRCAALSAVLTTAMRNPNEEIFRTSVEDRMTQDSTFPIEFIGGSRDGEICETNVAPDYCEVSVRDGVKEIYQRENSEPPFIYVQIGYAGNETWT